MRRLAADLIGPHGGSGDGFKIEIVKDDNGNPISSQFGIMAGHYYVGGVLCENDAQQLYTAQPGFPFDGDGSSLNGKTYVAYLDVWERHVTEIEDEDENRIGIREVALRGPDTATRAQVVCQVKTLPITAAQQGQLTQADSQAAYAAFLNVIGKSAVGSPLLRARAIKPTEPDEPCLVSPQSRYRGAENQLYRVEIHRSGVAWDGKVDGKNNPAGNEHKAATFKWSRENGSVIFPIKTVAGTAVTLENLGHDARFGLQPNDWVEIVDDDYVLQNRAEPLLQVADIDRDNLIVTLKNASVSNVGTDAAKHPLLRRWDQHRGWKDEGAVLVHEGSGDDDSAWIELEDGVQVQFPLPGGVSYHTGDYWVLPTRVATGDVEWPGPVANPTPLPPKGIRHYYAPVAIVPVAAGGQLQPLTDLRRILKPLF